MSETKPDLPPLIKWLLSILAALILMGASAIAGAMWSHEGRIIQQREAIESLQAQVSSLQSSIDVLASLVHKSTRDRYFAADAKADKAELEVRLLSIESQLQNIADAM